MIIKIHAVSFNTAKYIYKLELSGFKITRKKQRYSIEKFEYYIKIENLDDFFKIIDICGDIIIGKNSITIYDDYIE